MSYPDPLALLVELGQVVGQASVVVGEQSERAADDVSGFLLDRLGDVQGDLRGGGRGGVFVFH